MCKELRISWYYSSVYMMLVHMFGRYILVPHLFTRCSYTRLTATFLFPIAYTTLVHTNVIVFFRVLANLRTGLDLRTNTSAHFTWSSPWFIPVVLISGLIFAKTHSPSHVIAWDTTCIYQQFNTQQFLSLFLYSGYF